MTACGLDETREESKAVTHSKQDANTSHNVKNTQQCILVNYFSKKPKELQKAFMTSEEELQSYKMKLVRSFASSEDEESVFFLLEIGDYNSAESFLLSSEFNGKLSRSQLTLKPTVQHFNCLQKYNSDNLDSTNFLMVSHPVDDVKAWEAIFNASSHAREQKGITVLNVLSDYQDSKNITILFSVGNTDSVTNYFNNPGSRVVIAQSGVSGTPDVKFFNLL